MSPERGMKKETLPIQDFVLDNRCMNPLRNQLIIRRLVLGWFLLFVGASIVSSFIKPASMQLVCSAAGTVKLTTVDPVGDNTGEDSSHTGMSCALCAAVIVLLPSPDTLAFAKASTGFVPLTTGKVEVSTTASPPLPPRGPPLTVRS